MDKETVVRVHCISHTYQDKTEIKICGLDFLVGKGEKVAVLGPNGCGKTTLLKHILGILVPKEGEVEVFGFNPSKEFEKMRRRIGVVLQEVDEQMIGPTVYDDIIFSPLNYGYRTEDAERMADRVMQKLEISHLKDKIPHYLSGGEKKKVALAGALILEPEILILDEPFSNLDPKSEEEIIQILKEINLSRCTTLITALHDVELVSEIADSLYLMNSKGELSEKGESREILKNTQLLERFNLKRRTLV
ncbi:MAG: energy-coupling factor ABC transporter ATP-binding protein [candidate division Zixibacteria bacterium]|nr:energy-coupling factor ABC transporter ATP-binding protein [candidate division Zixibacteria bacterium]